MPDLREKRLAARHEIIAAGLWQYGEAKGERPHPEHTEKAMAGQPPERPWQSGGQAGRAQGGARQGSTAWQPAQPPPQEHHQPESREQGQGYEDYPGYQAQQAMWGQPGEQAAWQAAAARRPTGKGFVASLFDFSFTSFVTPKVVKGLYVLGTIWTALWAILLFLIGLHFGHATFGTFIFLIVAVAVFILLSLGVLRVVLEYFMVLFRINENIQQLRDRDRS